MSDPSFPPLPVHYATGGFREAMPQSINYFDYPVLVVDDEKENLAAFELNFRDQFEIVTAESGSQAIALLESRDFGVIISDQRMPGMTGVELLERTVARWPLLIRMILTGYTDNESLIDAINMGRIYKYITKPWDPDSLAITIRRAIESAAMARENLRLVDTLRRQNEILEQTVQERTRDLSDAVAKLQKLAVTDGLTGLYNHRYFQEKWQEEVRRARRYDEPLSLLMIDLDEFKNYNDSLGHPQGDVLLHDVASHLEQSFREVDFVARYGGEEFVIILPSTSKGAAHPIAERIRKSLEDTPFPFRDVQPSGRVTASFGIAAWPEDGVHPWELLERADRALYAAKRTGRNRVVAYGEEVEALRASWGLPGALSNAERGDGEPAEAEPGSKG